MFAIGHFALGYMTGKLFSKLLNMPINLPLLFFASVLPDVDLLFPFIEHRGPLHSIIFWCIFFIPIFWLYKKRAVPYFVVVIQHSLLGDFLTGGSQILWPFSLEMFGLDIGIRSLFNLSLEFILFAVSIIVLLKANDFKLFLNRDSTNFVLLMPLMTVLLPIIVNFPLNIPLILVGPHIFFIGLFMISLYNASE